MDTSMQETGTMTANRNHPNERSRPSNKAGWLIGGVFIALLVILALNGSLRGLAEAVGITEAAPGDDAAAPAAETVNREGE